MSQLFRKKALKRLASPEQLDQLLQVTTPKSWLALISIFLIFIYLMGWSILGRIPTKIACQGILTKGNDITQIMSEEKGQIAKIHVNENEYIEKGTLLMVIEQTDLEEALQNAKMNLYQAQQELNKYQVFVKDISTVKKQYYASKQTWLENLIVQLKQEASQLENLLRNKELLYKKSLITKDNLLETKNDYNELLIKIVTNENDLKKILTETITFKQETDMREQELNYKIQEAKLKLEFLNKKQTKTTQIISPISGRIIEIEVDNGQQINARTPLISIEPSSSEHVLDAILLIPARSGKEVLPGMKVEISPDPIKKEEYGFIWGRIQHVSIYPTSRESLMRTLKNEAIVEDFTKNGPILKARAKLACDPNSLNGYKWSSKRGGKKHLYSGTLCTAQIITQYQRPINLVIPFIKKVVGL